MVGKRRMWDGKFGSGELEMGRKIVIFEVASRVVLFEENALLIRSADD